jgi:hypothetical protein
MERKVGGVDQNKVKQSATDFVQDNALVKEIDSKIALSSKGEKVLRGLQESLGQSNSDTSGAQ